MENILPFGSGNSGDIPVQSFFGATVSRFSSSADFASQPGTCSIDLIQDDVAGDVFLPGVIGSPQFFKIVDVLDKTIFEFNGVLDSVSRDTSASSKMYKVVLVGPLRILEAVTIILDGYTGYGTAREGLPQFYSEDGYYNIGEDDKEPGYAPDGVTTIPVADYFEVTDYSFATNNSNLNFTGMWNRVFNLLNVFGAYENESISMTDYAGFGASSSVRGGMRVDKIAYALDQLINHAPPDSLRRYLGGNILYGTSTYNVCATATGYEEPMPYYYGVDIIDFISKLLNYLPQDFLVPGPSLTLAEFIGTVSDIVNADFIVELNDAATYKDGEFLAMMDQTYPASSLGGIISFLLIPRNEYVNCDAPFSNFTYDLINLEKPDRGDFGYSESKINPGVLTQSGNPLDMNFTYRGTEGSSPYGGSFPEGTGTSRGSFPEGTGTPVEIRASDISVSLKSSSGTVGKMVTGGFQTRMNVVPRDYIYQYWGEITLVDSPSDTCGITTSSQKSIPVITQILPPNDTWDWIAIDLQDIFGQFTVPGLLYSGIYFASVTEIRSAMDSFEAWYKFLSTFKMGKHYLFGLNVFKNIKNAAQFRYPARIKRYIAAAKQVGGDIEIADNSEKPEPTTVGSAKNSVLTKIHEKISGIGNEHYGKSWVAPVPFMRTKQTFSEDNLVGNFVRSWDIADSAYVEPYAYKDIEAPKDSRFIDDGRLKAFANFEHSFSGDAGSIGYDIITGELTGFLDGISYKFDFSSSKDTAVFDTDPSATGNCTTVGLAHIPAEIDKEILLISPRYFDFYNRGHCPFLNLSTTGVTPIASMYTYEYPMKQSGIPQPSQNKYGIVSSLTNDPNFQFFFEENQIQATISFNEDDPSGYYFAPKSDLFNPNPPSGFVPGAFSYVETFNSKGALMFPMPSGSGHEAFFSYHLSGSAFYDVLKGITDTPAGDNGSGLPMVRFSTNPVYYPKSISANGFNPLTSDFADAFEENIRAAIYPNIKQSSRGGFDTEGFNNQVKNGLAPAPVAPRSVGIPQRSNRYTYGPWITNFSNVIYAGKFEYEQKEELTPENFLIPIYGTTDTNWNIMDGNGGITRVIESIDGSNLSGFAGMNLAGQAIANSIDGFSLFAQEEGTVTIPGLPLISKVGQFLFDGPRISDVSINFDSNGNVSTTYNFRSLSFRQGKTDRELVKNLRKMSNAIKAQSQSKGGNR